jgi:dihydrofolate synthase/folylpolyglutamate synthase
VERTPDSWLEDKFSGEFFTGRFDHISIVIEKLSLVPKNSKIVTIAGTNGKGQTARIIGEYLRLDSISYALWTSPHLYSVTERFHLSGNNVRAEDLLETFELVEAKLAKINSELSYFEFLFISFLQLTEVVKPEIIILEVGLGGRLDATNAIDTDLAVVTSISRDHQDILGTRFDTILAEKLAISRPQRPLVTAFELAYLRDRAKNMAIKNNVNWIDLFQGKILNTDDNFSKRNQAISRKIFELLFNKSPKKMEIEDFESSRKEIEKNDAIFSLFPSHNVDGLRKLVQFLNQVKCVEYDLVLLSFSRRNLDDVRAMCKILELYMPREKTLLVEFSHSKALLKNSLNQISDETGINICVDVEKTIKKSIDQKKRVLVTGSNYFLGYFSKYF